MNVYIVVTDDPYLGYDRMALSTLSTSHETTKRLADKQRILGHVVKINVDKNSQTARYLDTIHNAC